MTYDKPHNSLIECNKSNYIKKVPVFCGVSLCVCVLANQVLIEISTLLHWITHSLLYCHKLFSRRLDSHYLGYWKKKKNGKKKKTLFEKSEPNQNPPFTAENNTWNLTLKPSSHLYALWAFAPLYQNTIAIAL